MKKVINGKALADKAFAFAIKKLGDTKFYGLTAEQYLDLLARKEPGLDIVMFLGEALLETEIPFDVLVKEFNYAAATAAEDYAKIIRNRDQMEVREKIELAQVAKDAVCNKILVTIPVLISTKNWRLYDGVTRMYREMLANCDGASFSIYTSALSAAKKPFRQDNKPEREWVVSFNQNLASPQWQAISSFDLEEVARNFIGEINR